MSKIMYRVEVVVYEIQIEDDGDEEVENVVFEALVGEAEEGDKHTYQDIIAEDLLGASMAALIELAGGGDITPDKALEDFFMAIYG